MASIEADSPKIPVRISAAVGAGGTNSIADVIGVEIHLNIFISAGAVKGAKFLFTAGKMTPEFVEAIRKFQRQVVGLSNPDGRVDPNGTTLKFLNGPTSARGGKFTPAPGIPPASIPVARKQIAETARKFLREGGHFLIGAIGDMPGRANGHPNRLAFVRPITFFDHAHFTKLGPAVDAAWLVSGKHGTLGCMGRPVDVGIRDHKVLAGSAKAAMIETYGLAVGRMRDAGIPVHRWPGFEFYEKKQTELDAAVSFADFDSLLTGATQEQFPRRISPGGPFHLGESCTDRRHYDCIGFVNFVLSKVLSPTFQRSMEYFTTPHPKKRFEVTIFDDKKKVFALAEPGDLVFKEPSERHCGIVSMHGKDRVVTNCRGMEVGLIDSVLSSEWRSLARLRR